jgi:hypothetical protein
MTNIEEQPWLPMLRDALAVLALPASDQVQVSGPGCLACDLLNDFDNARRAVIANMPGLPKEQRKLLDRIDAAMQAMVPADFECFNNDVVQRPAWQQLRGLAAEALTQFGWATTEVQPSVEIQPGIWHRPLAGI